MSDEPQAQDELDELMDDFADGGLDSDRARRLMERLAADPSARDRLAATVVIERLLRAHGAGATPTSRIMDAVRSASAPAPNRVTPPLNRSRSRPRSILWAFATMVLVAVAIVAALHRPRDAAVTKPTTRTAEHIPSPAEPTAPPAPPRIVKPVEPEPVEQAQVPIAPPQPPVLQRAVPFELPPPPADVGPAPDGDGRNEPGFVPPPAGIAAHPATIPAPGEPAPPLLWVNLRRGDARPESSFTGSLEALLDELHRTAGVRYATIAERLPATGDQTPDWPAVFFSTHYRFELTNGERAALRRYLLSGGMLVFNAGLGSRPAYEAMRRELRMILPEFPLARLPADHPLFHSLHDVAHLNYPSAFRTAGQPDDRPWLEGVTLACRTVAVISRWDMAAGWDGRHGEGWLAYPPEDARRLGINISIYAATVRAWSRETAGASMFPQADVPDSGRLFAAQVEYDGEWRTRFAGLQSLLHTFNQRTEVPVKLGVQTLRLTDPRVFNAPLLYLTGHDRIALTPDEKNALQRYVQSGGFLFAESCCGRAAFDESFRALMRDLFPASALEPVPESSALFSRPNRIEDMAVTKQLGARIGSMLSRPRLEGIRTGDTYGVIYSPYGLAGAWEASTMPYASAYEGTAAIRLGQNILMYAVTQ